jgi:hypothetical protein
MSTPVSEVASLPDIAPGIDVSKSLFTTSHSTQLTLDLPPPAVTGEMPLVPVRMVNEWVYCPRLAFLEWVDGEWADSGDTEAGRRAHVRVDTGGGRLPSTRSAISELRLAAAAGRIPPPLVDSPKCTKCSLAGICLPDEVAFFRQGMAPRALNPSADTALPLYVQEPGARITKSGEVLVVSYDISNDRRWRRVFKLMRGYGQWLQLSVFQCRLTARRRVELMGGGFALIRGNAAAASLKQR